MNKAFSGPFSTNMEIANSTINLVLQLIEARKNIWIRALLIGQVCSASVNRELRTEVNHQADLFLGRHFS